MPRTARLPMIRVLLLAAALVALCAVPVVRACGYEELAKANLLPREEDMANGVSDGGAAVSPDDVARSSTSGAYAPIRIGVFYEDLKDSSRYCTRAGQVVPDFKGGTVTCTADDILTDAKKDLLINKLLPAAVGLHSERLSVQSVNGLTLKKPMSSAGCGAFTVPSEHYSQGVVGFDYLLYVSAAPTEGNVVAWAAACLRLANKRAASGVTNISPKYIADSHISIRAVAHELLHALGFSSKDFDLSGITAKASARGKTNLPAITAPRVLSAARQHFDCSAIKAVELEDAGGRGSVGSHWKRRNLKDELMNPVISHGYYTAMTIAAMESLGFFRGNYDKAEVMPYGHNVGCDALREKCLTNSKSIAPSMFCTERDTKLCTSARDGVSACFISDKAYTGWASGYGLWSSDQTMDYCPYVVRDDQRSCASGVASLLPFSTIGASSRCLDTTLSTPVCAAITCGADSYTVQFGSGSRVPCTPGTTVTVPGSGGVATCPPYIEVCDTERYVAVSGGISASGVMGVAATGCCGVLLALAGALVSMLV